MHQRRAADHRLARNHIIHGDRAIVDRGPLADEVGGGHVDVFGKRHRPARLFHFGHGEGAGFGRNGEGAAHDAPGRQPVQKVQPQRGRSGQGPGEIAVGLGLQPGVEPRSLGAEAEIRRQRVGLLENRIEGAQFAFEGLDLKLNRLRVLGGVGGHGDHAAHHRRDAADGHLDRHVVIRDNLVHPQRQGNIRRIGPGQQAPSGLAGERLGRFEGGRGLGKGDQSARGGGLHACGLQRRGVGFARIFRGFEKSQDNGARHHNGGGAHAAGQAFELGIAEAPAEGFFHRRSGGGFGRDGFGKRLHAVQHSGQVADDRRGERAIQ
ncbi:MAG: hypothetical protein BWZ10_03396 [candidate division BRC1 bacterium ADurb.BinA364]|nr:MAG: hypothetical protein BWZ10_03396 [candidate division BRC1 bacterium ADurb.BinA364]